jgi:hypothetical protein
LGGWDQEARSSKPALGNSFQGPMCKITRVKWIGSVAWVVENLFCKCKALSWNPISPKKKKKKKGAHNGTLGSL